MKLKVVIELETLEQVGILLSTVKDWDVNVDVTPVFETTDRPRRNGKAKHFKRKSKGKQKRTHFSSPETMIKTSGKKPTSLSELFDEFIPSITKWPLTRTEVARQLAAHRGQSDTKATSTVITKWIKQGALKVVGGQ